MAWCGTKLATVIQNPFLKLGFSPFKELALTMRRFFENKLAFAAVVVLFALAFAWNLAHGAAVAPSTAPLPVSPDVSSAVTRSAHEAVRIAIGPTCPPPPWEELRVVA